MRICVYEDRHVRGLEPLTLTRPAADLLCGLTILLEKHVRYFNGDNRRASVPAGRGRSHTRARPGRERQRRDLAARRADSARERALGAAAAIARNPAPQPRRHLITRTANPFADAPYIGTANGAVAFAVLDTRHLEAVSPATLDDCLDEWSQSLPAREVGGTVVARPWELIDLNGEQIARDFEATCDPTDVGFHPTGFAVVGHADRLLIDPTAQVDPMVVADTTHGPVVIGPDAVVHAFTRLEGPCSIGAGTIVHGAKIRRGTTFGPHCRVGGEIESSIVLGYTNKYHEGFLGHSYLGEWVNLAAGTHTSDLRCDYRPVSVPVDGAEVPTGRDEGRRDRRRSREDRAQCALGLWDRDRPVRSVVADRHVRAARNRRSDARWTGRRERTDRHRPLADGRRRGHAPTREVAHIGSRNDLSHRGSPGRFRSRRSADAEKCLSRSNQR